MSDFNCKRVRFIQCQKNTIIKFMIIVLNVKKYLVLLYSHLYAENTPFSKCAINSVFSIYSALSWLIDYCNFVKNYQKWLAILTLSRIKDQPKLWHNTLDKFYCFNLVIIFLKRLFIYITIPSITKIPH